jgi:hypothetical protein
LQEFDSGSTAETEEAFDKQLANGLAKVWWLKYGWQQENRWRFRTVGDSEPLEIPNRWRFRTVGDSETVGDSKPLPIALWSIKPASSV